MKSKTLALSTVLLAMAAPFLAKADPVSYASLHPDQKFEAAPQPSAPVEPRISCPKPEEKSTPPSYNFKAAKINLINEIEPVYLNQFIYELEKFPSHLRSEMVRRGAEINLMQGSGVTVDPSWVDVDVKTFDGRPWSEVPGSGGHKILYVEKAVPTRIVANHLYDNHGSINLVLHEKAHTLDNLYLFDGVSKSKVWKDLMAANPGIKAFLGTICHKGYCDSFESEAFAELMAYNYACDATQDDLEAKFPAVSAFFRELNSVEDIHLDEGTLEKPAAQLERVRSQQVREYEEYIARNPQKAEGEVSINQPLRPQVTPRVLTAEEIETRRLNAERNARLRKEAAEKAAQLREEAAEKAGQLLDGAGEVLGDLKEGAGEVYQNLKDRASRFRMPEITRPRMPWEKRD